MNCLICNETLTEANASDEHIILNSLGGHLHSKDLLCKKCNNKFGKEADAEQRILYGYVDLFGILQCLVLLSDCYSGKNYMESYVYDVNEGKEINKTPAIRLERDEIQKIVRGTEASWVDGVLRQTRLFHEKAGEIVKERVLDGMWQRIMDQSLGKYPEGVLITEEMLGEVLAEMKKEMIPWYVSRICGTDL